MLHIGQEQHLLQRLSPQQVQYLKLLQVPTVALEQRLKLELETNPLLEEGLEEELELLENEEAAEAAQTDDAADDAAEVEAERKLDEQIDSLEDFMNDDPSAYKTPRDEDQDREEYPTPAQTTMAEHLLDQLRLLDLTPAETRLGEEIIGNIDEDGYLRRDLELIVHDLNSTENLSLTLEQAEKVLGMIQTLDPVGIGARTLRECLLVQVRASNTEAPVRDLAVVILEKYFDDFTMKHFVELARALRVERGELRRAVELIQRMNPKPGEGQFSAQENYVTPDFLVENINGEFVVTLNDKNVPPLRINKAYRQLISRRKKNGISLEAKDFLRKKLEAAKWFIASIYQRRDTMMRVMKTIVEKQRAFFERGEEYLKPMIYRNIADVIGMDISTISRVVNGKYVQTDYGVYELRYFFSDGVGTATGEKMSNKGVKIRIRQIIDAEDPTHPLSDDDIADILKKEGLSIARRTVAKYREAMLLPVARLRRKV